jgi:hypothetical protein
MLIVGTIARIRREHFIKGKTIKQIAREQLDEAEDYFTLTIPECAKIPSGATRLVSYDSTVRIQRPRVDPALVKAIIRARAWLKLIEDGDVASVDELARKSGQHRTLVRETLRLAFLSPEITKLILQGRQPTHVTLAALSRIDLPLSWDEQRRILLAGAVDPLPTSSAN